MTGSTICFTFAATASPPVSIERQGGVSLRCGPISVGLRLQLERRATMALSQPSDDNLTVPVCHHSFLRDMMPASGTRQPDQFNRMCIGYRIATDIAASSHVNAGSGAEQPHPAPLPRAVDDIRYSRSPSDIVVGIGVVQLDSRRGCYRARIQGIVQTHIVGDYHSVV